MKNKNKYAKQNGLEKKRPALVKNGQSHLYVSTHLLSEKLKKIIIREAGPRRRLVASSNTNNNNKKRETNRKKVGGKRCKRCEQGQ